MRVPISRPGFRTGKPDSAVLRKVESVFVINNGEAQIAKPAVTSQQIALQTGIPGEIL